MFATGTMEHTILLSRSECPALAFSIFPMKAADLPFSAARNMAVRPHCEETSLKICISNSVRTMHVRSIIVHLRECFGFENGRRNIIE